MDERPLIPWPRVAALLRRAGRTQAWLAQRLNVASQVVTNWKARGGVPAARAKDLARALGVGVEGLFADEVPAARLSPAGQRLVDRVAELDQRGLLTPLAEHAAMAVFDLVEGIGSGAGQKPRR